MSEKRLDADTDDTVRMSPEDARGLGEAALASVGYAADDARAIATHLVDAAMWGYEFAGLPRILVIADRPELKRPRTPVTIVKETPVSALVDGGNNIGYLSIYRTAEIAIEKARASGIALCGLRNSWFGGRGAYYLEKIARAGLGAIYAVSSTPTVVPIGAKKKALGTNPLAIALPGRENPLIFDMGTASVMSGEILMKAFLDESFDETLGIDREGAPTARARDLVEGGVYAFGGHKGYGLSVVIQALGLLAGAKFRAGDVTDFGIFLIAFDPELLMPAGQYEAELDELLTRIRSLPRQPGVEQIRIPSERGFREREIRRREGILVNRRVVDRLRQMAGGAQS